MYRGHEKNINISELQIRAQGFSGRQLSSKRKVSDAYFLCVMHNNSCKVYIVNCRDNLKKYNIYILHLGKIHLFIKTTRMANK